MPGGVSSPGGLFAPWAGSRFVFDRVQRGLAWMWNGKPLPRLHPAVGGRRSGATPHPEVIAALHQASTRAQAFGAPAPWRPVGELVIGRPQRAMGGAFVTPAQKPACPVCGWNACLHWPREADQVRRLFTTGPRRHVPGSSAGSACQTARPADSPGVPSQHHQPNTSPPVQRPGGR